MARLKRARINLLMDEPFFGNLMMQLTPVETRSVKRFCTNGDKLWFNPDYMATLDDGQLRTLCAHEVLHPGLLHPYRQGDREHRLCNISADYVVNNFLDNYNLAAAKRGEPSPFPWPVKNGKPDVLLDHAYDDMSFEQVYSELQRKRDNGDGDGQPQPQPGNGSGGTQSQPGGQQPGQGKPDPNGPPSEAQGDDAGPGDFVAGPPDPAEAQAQEAKWKVALKQAAMMAKAQGRLPAEMDRLVTDLLDPKASWREILRTLLTSAAKDDYTWSRPNRRFAGRGIILPSLWVPRMGKVAVAIDTSGSIGEKELNEFLAEVRAILFDCRPEKMILMQCDARLQEYVEIDPFDEVDVHLKGGGGTDFCPVFERLEEEPEPPAALVYLTDLEGTFPDHEPSYPVIWACNQEKNGPFGDTVHI